MLNIKVIYQSTARRFTIQDSEKITWSEFEKRTRNLFNLPSWTQFTLSYTDEEGDNITLSTDFELEEVINDHIHNKNNKKNNSLKFNVKTIDNNHSNDDNQINIISDTFGIDEVPSFARDKNEASSFARNKKKDDVVLEEEEVDEFVNIEPTFHPTITIGVEQKEKEPIKENSSKDNAINKKESNIEKRSKDNKFEQLPPPVPLPSQDQQASVTALAQEFQILLDQNQPYILNTFTSLWRNHDADNGTQGSGAGVHQEQDYSHELSPNAINSILDALDAMGFGNDQQNKELLYMYNGNVESVVEELLAKRAEH
ncbi:2577_t:CDS:2 [Ambispora gerdemannii]|uniref:2577_t:CDS:1 n=1 Tax=Ambispora gerdemannii TaxID=144530 RepID=A0A9N9FDJ1_9GLOM|nr:2577_t:CDS:2 [Ambispora gerdemannii]